VTPRLTCSHFWVDVRVRRVEGRWLASADTPDGPTLGYGDAPLEALTSALDDFSDVRKALLASLDEGSLPHSPKQAP
jgi:hypothetical protein